MRQPRLENGKTTLGEVVSWGPVQRGFYVSCGGRSVQIDVLDRMMDVLVREARTPGLPVTNAHLDRSHRRCSYVGQMIWIDTDGSLEPSAVARAAARRGLDPFRASRAVRVWHADTVPALADALSRVPNAALAAFPFQNETRTADVRTVFGRPPSLGAYNPSNEPVFSEPSAVWWTPLVVIGSLAAPFEARQAGDEARWAFDDLFLRLSHLRQRAVVVGFHLHEDGRPTAPAHLARMLSLAQRLSPDSPENAPSHIASADWSALVGA